MADSPIARHRIGLTSLAANLAVLGLLGLAGGAAAAADAATGATQTVYLEYQDFGAYVRGWSLDITPEATPFKKEPDWGGRHICRGTINSATRGPRKPGADPSHAIALPFAWDYTQRKLHLDLNRNGDLTAETVCLTDSGYGDYFYQSFTNLHLVLNPGAPAHPVRVDINLFTHQGKDISGGTLMLHSFWQGKAVLRGQECQVGLIEDADHLGSTERAFLLLRRWEERAKPFNLEDGLLPGVEFCTNLFAYGQAYRLACAYQPGDVPKYKLELTEAQAELGEVELTGKSLHRVVFREHQANVPFTVLLDRPEPKVRIPVGTYNKYWAALKEKNTEATCHYADWLHPKPVTITASNLTRLPIGGPLTNWVTVQRHGGMLSFSYEVRGAGGRYRLVGPGDRSKPPQLAIYQNGRPVSAGEFEYG